MTNETIFLTQITSILLFVITLFALYRVLVSNKDATIQLLKEKGIYLNEQITILRESSPDKLAKNLSERVQMLTQELDRLSVDRHKNIQTIHKKEEDLKNTQKDLSLFKEQLAEAQEIASEYFCPYCKSPMEVREYHDESQEEGDINHEYISFVCGYTLIDGKEDISCPHKNLT